MNRTKDEEFRIMRDLKTVLLWLAGVATVALIVLIVLMTG